MARIDLQYLINRFPNEKQVLFLTDFFSRFDYNVIGLNRHIDNIEPLVYQGASAGSEFLTYVVTKMYLCFSFAITRQSVTTGTSPYVRLYNENDVTQNYFCDAEGYHNSVTKNNYNKLNNFTILQPISFSRILVNQYAYIKFIGYRITLN